MATTTTHLTYGSPVSLGVKRRVSSKYKIRNGFSYPLIEPLPLPNPDGPPPTLQKTKTQRGYFSKAYGLNLVRNNLRQLLLCEKGTRIMLPDYGLGLNKYLFEPLDETTFYLIKNEILTTLAKYFSIASVLSLRVFGNPIEQDQHQLIIQLTLQLNDESLEVFDTEVTIG